MNSNGNCRGSMSPSSNTGGGAPGGIHLAAATAVAAPVSVQAVQAAGGVGGGLGVGISNDGLSSSFNPANPLAGVYSPKTSHLSIVQQQLEQVNFVIFAICTLN